MSWTPEVHDRVMAAYRAVKASEWPRYDVDPVKCMERAAEFIDRRREIEQMSDIS